MPRSHCKYTNNKDSMFPPKVSAPKVMFPERRNLYGKQDNDFKIEFRNAFKEPKRIWINARMKNKIMRTQTEKWNKEINLKHKSKI